MKLHLQSTVLAAAAIALAAPALAQETVRANERYCLKVRPIAGTPALPLRDLPAVFGSRTSQSDFC